MWNTGGNLHDSTAFLNQDFESLAPPSGNQHSKQKRECNLQNRADCPLDMFVRIAKCYNLEIELRVLYFFRFHENCTLIFEFHE